MQWLEVAMQCGISEVEFWNMTYAELLRAIEVKQQQQRQAEKEKAVFDYILADLIGRSVSRLYSSSAVMPNIAEAYPALFNTGEIQQTLQERKNELSILRFKQFANTHNEKFKGVQDD